MEAAETAECAKDADAAKTAPKSLFEGIEVMEPEADEEK